MRKAFAFLFAASLLLAACVPTEAPASAQDLPAPSSGLVRELLITGDGIAIRTGGVDYTLHLKDNATIAWSRFDPSSGTWSAWTEVPIERGDFLLLPQGEHYREGLPPSGSFLVYVQGPNCVVQNPFDGSCIWEAKSWVFDVSWIP